MTPPREPPAAARIAEIRRRHAEIAAELTPGQDLWGEDVEVADLLAALDYCRDTLEWIERRKYGSYGRCQIQARQLLDRLFREEAL